MQKIDMREKKIMKEMIYFQGQEKKNVDLVITYVNQSKDQSFR